MTPAGIEPATFRFTAQHLNHCGTDTNVVSEFGIRQLKRLFLAVRFKLAFLHLCTYYNLVKYVGESVYAEVPQGIHYGPRLRS